MLTHILFAVFSTELMRLDCLLAVFLLFDLAAVMLQQLTGIAVSDATIWQWIQSFGQHAIEQLKVQLQHLANGRAVCDFLPSLLQHS